MSVCLKIGLGKKNYHDPRPFELIIWILCLERSMIFECLSLICLNLFIRIDCNLFLNWNNTLFCKLFSIFCISTYATFCLHTVPVLILSTRQPFWNTVPISSVWTKIEKKTKIWKDTQGLNFVLPLTKKILYMMEYTLVLRNFKCLLAGH